jgi:hypothetical protein
MVKTCCGIFINDGHFKIPTGIFTAMQDKFFRYYANNIALLLRLFI